MSDLSLGKSILHFISSPPLRIINSFVLSSSLKYKAVSIILMEVNSGKSIHHSLSESITLKHSVRAVMEGIKTKEKRFQTGQVYLSFPSLKTTLQFQLCIIETTTPFNQITHFNHFQSIHILNSTHPILIEGIITNLQFL